MNRSEYEWIRQYGTDNDYDIRFGDIFYLKYCGINVFFCVCKTSSAQCCIFELAKKTIKYEGKKVEVLCGEYKGSKKPLVVTEDNCYTKSRFWVYAKNKDVIWIPITSDLPLYKKACEQAKDFIPRLGDIPAIKLEEEKKNGILNYYWEV